MVSQGELGYAQKTNSSNEYTTGQRYLSYLESDCLSLPLHVIRVDTFHYHIALWSFSLSIVLSRCCRGDGAGGVSVCVLYQHCRTLEEAYDNSQI